MYSEYVYTLLLFTTKTNIIFLWGINGARDYNNEDEDGVEVYDHDNENYDNYGDEDYIWLKGPHDLDLDYDLWGPINEAECPFVH